MMGIIGFSVGIVGFLLHQIIDIISEFKWELTSYYIQVTKNNKGITKNISKINSVNKFGE